MIRNIRPLILITLLVNLGLISSAVAADKSTNTNESWIYRTSNTPATSCYLGVETYPVSVEIAGKRQPALYIAALPKCLGYEMGLVKGSVVLQSTVMRSAQPKP